MRVTLALLLAFATFAAGCSGSEPDPTPADDGALPDDGNATRALPAVLHFEFGPTGGCNGEAYTASGGAAPLTCASFQGGLDADGIDGRWMALNESYWGLQLNSTVLQSPTGPQPVPVVGSVLGDSDCVFTNAQLDILADGNNGLGPCTLVVPQGTAYVFLYPYSTPATEMTVDFALPA